jgi:hypothetical protein
MRSDDIQHEEGAGSAGRAGGGGSTRARYTRRQMLGRVSTAGAVGAAAWVVPEILTAKPAAGATLSGGGTNGSGGGTPTGVGTSPSTTGSSNTPSTGSGTTGAGTTPVATSGSLAFTGIDIKRDVEVGAAMVAGGWAMHKWASRTPKVAGAHVRGAHAKADEAGSPGDTA